jgi:hypothetical protein
MENKPKISPFTSGGIEQRDIPRLEDAVTFTDEEVYNDGLWNTCTHTMTIIKDDDRKIDNYATKL